MKNYTDTIISQYANSPTLTRLIDLYNAYLDMEGEIQSFRHEIWDIDTCNGSGLDMWGKIVGVSRFLKMPVRGEFFGFQGGDGVPFGVAPFYNDILQASTPLGDENYRRIIKIKMLANITRCTIPDLNRILKLVVPNVLGYVLEVAPMAVAYVIVGKLSEIDYAILTQSGVMPRPAGVNVRVIQIDPTTTLGFSEANVSTPKYQAFGFGTLFNLSTEEA